MASSPGVPCERAEGPDGDRASPAPAERRRGAGGDGRLQFMDASAAGVLAWRRGVRGCRPMRGRRTSSRSRAMSNRQFYAAFLLLSIAFIAGCTPLLPPAPSSYKIWPAPGFPQPANFYPKDPLFNREQGTALVRMCVGSGGTLTRPPELMKSSGNARLDDAALEYASATSGHWLVRKPMCINLPVIFKINSKCLIGCKQ